MSRFLNEYETLSSDISTLTSNEELIELINNYEELEASVDLLLNDLNNMRNYLPMIKQTNQSLKRAKSLYLVKRKST